MREKKKKKKSSIPLHTGAGRGLHVPAAVHVVLAVPDSVNPALQLNVRTTPVDPLAKETMPLMGGTRDGEQGFADGE